MNWPIHIDNEPELQRLVRDIATEVVRKISINGIESIEKKSELMTKQEAYKTPGVGRVLVDRAIHEGSLKLHVLNGRTCIIRKDFNNWLNKSQL